MAKANSDTEIKKAAPKKEVAEKKAPAKKAEAKAEAPKKETKKAAAKKEDAKIEAPKGKASEQKEEVKSPEVPSEEVPKAAILDKKPVRKANPNEKWAILHIYSSYNNTHLHVTDVTGSETIVKVTGGMVTKSDRLKPTPNVAMAAAKQVAEGCQNAGVNALYVKLRAVGGHNGPMTPGPGSQAAIKTLTRNGIKLGRIEDVTPIPHDTCRRKGGKRGRRV